MAKKTRLLILFACVVLFFLISPILVAYSMGYRFDFEKIKVVATGGIYVRTFPAADKITIDSKISEKPGLFSNWIFVQSLLPKNHTISIEKSGYYGYSKILPVEENRVTKAENILLIKKTLAFNDVYGSADYFSVAPNNQNVITASANAKSTNFNYFSLSNPAVKKTFSILQSGKVSAIKWSPDSSHALIKITAGNNNFYYISDTTLQKPTAIRLSYLDKNSQQISFDPQDNQTIFYIKNKTLYSAKGNNSLPIINNVISFRISGTNIVWLSSKGVLSNSDFSGNILNEITKKDFLVDTQKNYDIILLSGNTFLKTDISLFKLNQTTGTFEGFAVPITNYEISASSDNNNFIYWNKENIYLYNAGNKTFGELFSGTEIANVQWLNNDYIIFNSAGKIIISEIDYRGNINSVVLPQTATLTFFDSQTGKLYILSANTLLASEKITP